MRMAELSRESGVPVATIKYYQREGLLPPGELTSPNQARYGAAHVRRLKLVRALLEIGGLSIAAVGEVLAAIDDSGTSTHGILGLAQHGLPMAKLEVTAEDRAWAMGRIGETARRRGWDVHPESPVVESLLGVLCALRQVGHEWVLDALDRYAEAADSVAEADVTAVARLGTTEAVVEGAVVGTVLGDALFAALRRMAHAQVSRRQFTG
ncbi:MULTISPECIES: MerR family transcriptional regulator [Amycolatopsis]|uniref:MerR family transcriptional regulator n=1 Tax=Amycolatopsis thermalba TaxID=944492 RepID=A0ABY4P267_9PSEU|nr:MULTISPECIES: MerR family transcriptional regulator [Amycolatopsis]OXM73451.1 MerR family transcriptional regulator [Amycolatopsis sp. KNN50.9b]UQS26452.1 MerR family transcriptional regulator [Amycolatopsis thermalba]